MPLWKPRPRGRRQTVVLVGSTQPALPAFPVPVDDRVRLIDAPYLLPKDAREKQRLNFQHHCLYSAIGNHYLAPLPPDITTMVDIGTGTVRRIGGR